MQSRKPHSDSGASNPTGKLFGWIDLDKSKRRVIAAFLITAALSMIAFGAKQEIGQLISGPYTSSAGSYFTWINPFALTPDLDELVLSREYLYAQDELLAVEEAGATSVPKADLAIWRPSSGQWWTKAGDESRQVTVQWGVASDKPAIGDYDGDGKTDFCVFRPSEGRWYLIKSSERDSGTLTETFGQSGDVTAAADYDGDGRTDFAVWRPATGDWYIKRSSDGITTNFQLGLNGDTPNPNDFDGDGKADIAVWRSSNSTFYSINSSDQEMVFTNMGISGEPVSADFDGDGRADYAVRNGSQWKIEQSSDGQTTLTTWQQATDLSVQNDYDGDGQVDIATFRPDLGKWYIRNSSDGKTRMEQWGTNGDVPLPALYRR